MDRRSDRGQATRQHIIATATQLFTKEGYEGTSIDLVLRTSGISKGALYHHFASKEALFGAVLEAVEARVAEQVSAAGREAITPRNALRAGCAAWLSLARDPTVRQVVLIDAPSVMGWQAWREIENRYSLGLIKAGLGAAVAAGRMRSEMVDFYAHIVLAVLIEMALLIARSDDASLSVQTEQEAVAQVFDRLIGEDSQGP